MLNIQKGKNGRAFMVGKRNGKSERINTTTTWFSTHRRKKEKCPVIEHTDKQKNNPNHR